MNTLPVVHFADNYLLNPTNPLTVHLIGAGGTGSSMLTALTCMNHTLIALGHPGLHVTVWDDDIVHAPNLGRQLFAEAELGWPKSVVSINRNNRFFGTNWKAMREQFGRSAKGLLDKYGAANIYISCVDKISARFEIAGILKGLTESHRFTRDKVLYWMDCGNAKETGQVMLSTLAPIKQPVSKLYRTASRLPLITDEFKSLLENQSDTDLPSCSVAEALEKQDLFINSTIANMGASLLSQLIRTGITENRGFFLNLKNFKCEPVKIQECDY